MRAYEEFVLHVRVPLLVQDYANLDEETVESSIKINHADLEDSRSSTKSLATNSESRRCSCIEIHECVRKARMINEEGEPLACILNHRTASLPTCVRPPTPAS